MRELIKTIKAENIKVRKNMMFISLCAFPIVVNVLLGAYYIFSSGIPAGSFWTYSLQLTNLFFAIGYPTVFALTAYTYVNIEDANNCSRLLNCMPRRMSNIYICKCMILLYYYTLTMIFAYVTYITSIFLLQIFSQEIRELVTTYNSKHMVDLWFLKGYIAFLPIIFFQHTLSKIFKGVWLPITTALILTVVGLLAYGKEKYYLLPHASFCKNYENLQFNHIIIVDEVLYISIIYTLIFVAIGYFAFKYKGKLTNN